MFRLYRTVACPEKLGGGGRRQSNFPTRDQQNIFNLILTYIYIYIYIYIYSGVGRCQKVGGGGGGAHRHVIYVPSVKNQYKRVVFGYMVIY